MKGWRELRAAGIEFRVTMNLALCSWILARGLLRAKR
jgi:hypothetical protein